MEQITIGPEGAFAYSRGRYDMGMDLKEQLYPLPETVEKSTVIAIVEVLLKNE